MPWVSQQEVWVHPTLWQRTRYTTAERNTHGLFRRHGVLGAHNYLTIWKAGSCWVLPI